MIRDGIIVDIILMSRFLVVAKSLASQGADQRKALMLIVNHCFKNALESSELTLDEFFNFCKDKKNHQGIRQNIDLAECKQHFLIAIQSESLVREILCKLD